MNYIVLDLEWNSAYYKPQGRFINENFAKRVYV